MNPNLNIIDNSILVIFGVSGDLSRRKILPAIYHLIKDNMLPEKMTIIGTSRKDTSLDKLMKDVELCVLEDSKVCDQKVLLKFKNMLSIIKFDPTNMNHYLSLKERFNKIENQNKECFNRLYYLSVPPSSVEPIIKKLGLSGLNKNCSHGSGKSRLLIEKPFGNDLDSAKILISEMSKFFKEDQIFRIDHYLAKETAQNIFTFRKHNPVFWKLWDKNSISSIEVRALEKIGIENRVNFYEHMGALKDLVQNHLIQLLSLITMEIDPNNSTKSSDIHKAKLKLLNQIMPLNRRTLKEVKLGQYKNYKKEVLNPNSNVETYVKLKLEINNRRWLGTPIYLETGKALDKKTTEIIVNFKTKNIQQTNSLTFRIQPNEGIDIKLIVKEPGLTDKYKEAFMDFSYQSTFKQSTHPDAYERVLVDALKGDQTLFATSSEVLASWKILEPLLKEWEKHPKTLKIYQEGSNPSNI